MGLSINETLEDNVLYDHYTIATLSLSDYFFSLNVDSFKEFLHDSFRHSFCYLDSFLKIDDCVI
jgi:hypothetical protein